MLNPKANLSDSNISLNNEGFPPLRLNVIDDLESDNWTEESRCRKIKLVNSTKINMSTDNQHNARLGLYPTNRSVLDKGMLLGRDT